jgi:hypothetical protein
MMPGPKPSPRRQLSPQFVEAIQGSGRAVWQLSVMAFMGRKLSTLLHNPFAATPLTIQRLQSIADDIGFRGELLAYTPPDDPGPSIEALARETRPAVAQTLHKLFPETALVDCVALVNAAIDEAIAGRPQRARAIQALLKQFIGVTRALLDDDATIAASPDAIEEAKS